MIKELPLCQRQRQGPFDLWGTSCRQVKVRPFGPGDTFSPPVRIGRLLATNTDRWN